jgi:hypothetical protein
MRETIDIFWRSYLFRTLKSIYLLKKPEFLHERHCLIDSITFGFSYSYYDRHKRSLVTLEQNPFITLS